MARAWGRAACSQARVAQAACPADLATGQEKVGERDQVVAKAHVARCVHPVKDQALAKALVVPAVGMLAVSRMTRAAQALTIPAASPVGLATAQALAKVQVALAAAPAGLARLALAQALAAPAALAVLGCQALVQALVTLKVAPAGLGVQVQAQEALAAARAGHMEARACIKAVVANSAHRAAPVSGQVSVPASAQATPSAPAQPLLRPLRSSGPGAEDPWPPLATGAWTASWEPWLLLAAPARQARQEDGRPTGVMQRTTTGEEDVPGAQE